MPPTDEGTDDGTGTYDGTDDGTPDGSAGSVGSVGSVSAKPPETDFNSSLDRTRITFLTCENRPQLTGTSTLSQIT